MVQVDYREFMERKRGFLERIERDKEIGYLDPDIEPLLKVINSRKKCYTTSSCSGRITIIDSVKPWVRGESEVVFKKHSKVVPEELLVYLKATPKYAFWVQATGPILHIITLDLNEAKLILEAGRRSGFKHSGIMSVSSKGFLVELVSGSQVNILLRTREAIVINPESINTIAEVLNSVIDEARVRIEKLKRELEKLGDEE